jgi:hypothetical protein
LRRFLMTEPMGHHPLGTTAAGSPSPTAIREAGHTPELETRERQPLTQSSSVPGTAGPRYSPGNYQHAAGARRGGQYPHRYQPQRRRGCRTPTLGTRAKRDTRHKHYLPLRAVPVTRAQQPASLRGADEGRPQVLVNCLLRDPERTTDPDGF